MLDKLKPQAGGKRYAEQINNAKADPATTVAAQLTTAMLAVCHKKHLRRAPQNFAIVFG